MAATQLRKEQTKILENIYQVGAIFVATVSTNPATLFGFGTWSAFGAGKALVSLDSGQTEFDTVEETGGSKTHTLTTSEIPSHLHSVDPPITTSGTESVTHTHGYTRYNTTVITKGGTNQTSVWGDGISTQNTGNASVDHTHTVDIAQFDSASAGSGTAHNNIQPSYVVYIWKRTA